MSLARAARRCLQAGVTEREGSSTAFRAAGMGLVHSLPSAGCVTCAACPRSRPHAEHGTQPARSREARAPCRARHALKPLVVSHRAAVILCSGVAPRNANAFRLPTSQSHPKLSVGRACLLQPRAGEAVLQSLPPRSTPSNWAARRTDVRYRRTRWRRLGRSRTRHWRSGWRSGLGVAHGRGFERAASR
jgi:hypothetical protein